MPVPSASPPVAINEPVKAYAPGSPERAELKAELARMKSSPVDIPMFIDGREVETGTLVEARSPHDKRLVLGRAHDGTAAHAEKAIEAALRARHEWSAMSQPARSAIFLRAAELGATRLRASLNASTMLGQSKTAVQAEIDSACELVDFLRFNVAYAHSLWQQPISSAGVWNALEPRPLEGFVLAVTPFNFTAIAANLPTAPALLGNVVVWKPSPNALPSAFQVLRLLREAGLPDGVINLVMGPPEEMVNACIDHPRFAGLHFTGSTAVFRTVWQRIAQNLGRYRGFPRIVGETGGKDFVFAHASADVDALAVALVRGAFEYQGQKCSAASRAYVPRSIWPAVKERVVGHMSQIRIGDVSDFTNLMGAVIDERAYARLTGVIAEAKAGSEYEIVHGGMASDEIGYFVHPTLVESSDPKARLMRDEFFGPVLTTFVYDDARADETLTLCDEGSDYALTGAVFATDRAFIETASAKLVDAAGNFYVNDKPTGAVVGQQPFGGARASGTNDKAGSLLNLHRWVSPRTVKETLCPPLDVGYPSMREG